MPVSWRGSLSGIRFAAMASISSRILNSHVEALCVIANCCDGRLHLRVLANTGILARQPVWDKGFGTGALWSLFVADSLGQGSCSGLRLQPWTTFSTTLLAVDLSPSLSFFNDICDVIIISFNLAQLNTYVPITVALRSLSFLYFLPESYGWRTCSRTEPECLIQLLSSAQNGNMTNEIDIENITIEQYLMLTQEKQTRGMIRTESGNDPNDYHLFTHQSHYETEEISSDKDVDEWLNEELSKRMTGQDKEEEEDALIDILKTQPSNETNLGSFTLPCTIGNIKIYDMADVGAEINMMPKSLFEHLKLANLKKTSMVIEMGNMTKRAPLGIVENIPVKIDKFLFHFDFVVIDTLEEPDETILLGRLFLAMIHAQIDVFRGEISLGVGNEKVNKESVDTVDSSSDSQENEVGSHLSEYVSRWHVCKPVHITFKVCEEDCGIWPTCNLDLSFCSGYNVIYKEENVMLKQWICFRDHERQNVGGNGIKFDDFLKVRYGNKNIGDVTHERRYYEWVAQNYDFKVKTQRTTKYTDPFDLHHKSDSPPNDTLHINTYFPDVSKTQPKESRIRKNSFEEWMKIKLGHTHISDSIRSMMFKEWENKDVNFEVNIGRTKDDPYSRNFYVYKDEFDKEIEQLVNEYELKARRKRYDLEEVWENVKNFMIQPNSGMMKDLRKRNFGKME
ncbi:phospholipase-like protein [Tanacetum coccineum]